MPSKKRTKKSTKTTLQSMTSNPSISAVRKRVAHVDKKVRSYVHEHPAQAALIAAGIGAAVGALVSSQWKKR